MIRSNSHVAVFEASKKNNQETMIINEKVVQLIVDKLGYSAEQVRYLVLSNCSKLDE